MKPNKQMIADEILFHLEAGKGFEETFELILTKRNLSRPTFATYWKVANEEFSKTLEGRKQLFEEKSIQAFIESVEEGLMRKYDKLKILEDIINCKTKFKKVFVSNGEQVILDIESDVNAVLKAIELHNRMQGDYKPDINLIRLGIDCEEEYV
jgi:uncharacterized protein YwqG